MPDPIPKFSFNRHDSHLLYLLSIVGAAFIRDLTDLGRFPNLSPEERSQAMGACVKLAELSTPRALGAYTKIVGDGIITPSSRLPENILTFANDILVPLSEEFQSQHLDPTPSPSV